MMATRLDPLLSYRLPPAAPVSVRMLFVLLFPPAIGKTYVALTNSKMVPTTPRRVVWTGIDCLG
jgi:hypothetical protein